MVPPPPLAHIGFTPFVPRSTPPQSVTPIHLHVIIRCPSQGLPSTPGELLRYISSPEYKAAQAASQSLVQSSYKVRPCQDSKIAISRPQHVCPCKSCTLEATIFLSFLPSLPDLSANFYDVDYMPQIVMPRGKSSQLWCNHNLELHHNWRTHAITFYPLWAMPTSLGLCSFGGCESACHNHH